MDDTSIDLRLDRNDDHETQVDMATFVAAKIFGEVALPRGISFAKAEFIEAAANSAQSLDYAGVTIGGAFGRPIGDSSARVASSDGSTSLAGSWAENIARPYRLRIIKTLFARMPIPARSRAPISAWRETC